MYVLNLMQCLNLGGMEQAAYLLMKATHAQSIHWQVQSVTPAGVGQAILHQATIPVDDHPYEGKFGYKSYASLKQKLAAFAGDLILVTGPTLTGCRAVHSHPAKKVLGVHFCHRAGLSNYLRWKAFYSYFGNRYDAIIYYSPYSLQEAKQIAPELASRFHLIDCPTQRCAAITPAERAIARQSLNLPPDAVVIGNAGWLIERKRFDVFLQIAAELCQSSDRELIFLIAGDGPLRADLETLAQQLTIANRVRFLGWQQDLHGFYQSLDLLLFNSNSDAFGLTVLEAMGYGIPVVASVLEGGTDTLITHDENGYLLPTHDSAQLTHHCLTLLHDPSLYQRFQSRSLERVRRRFLPDTYIQRHLDLFQRILNPSDFPPKAG